MFRFKSPMKTITAICGTLLLFGPLNLSTLGATQASQPVSGKAAFEVMKGLAGEWHGKVDDQATGPEATITYRVTSAGKAVLETLFPGTDHEMVTVYYLDGDKLVLTHYCAMGNQPRMVLSKNSTAQDLAFDFAGGSNINPKKDRHMHSARIQVEDAQTIKGEWVGFEDGKATGAKKFFLARKK